LVLDILKIRSKTITAVFFRLSSGKEPIRDWLLTLSKDDRREIGKDIMAVEYGWPCGEPLCRSLSGYSGLREVRSNIKHGIARVFFYVADGDMVLLHGFVKKSAKTPDKELKLASRRKKEHEKHGQEI
jgi:phage-related protein